MKSVTVRVLVSAALLSALTLASAFAQQLVPGGVHKQDLEARRRGIEVRVHEMRDHHALSGEHFRKALSKLEVVKADTHRPAPLSLSRYHADQHLMDDVEAHLSSWQNTDRH